MQIFNKEMWNILNVSKAFLSYLSELVDNFMIQNKYIFMIKDDSINSMVYSKVWDNFW